MPPDSKDLSSLKDKSPSFHRLHATDLDRMKGIYLSAEELRGFDKYKYKSEDTSPLSNYLTHPFWNFVVEFFPRWLAPNVLTFSGWSLLFLIYAVTCYYDPHFTAAGDPDESKRLPSLWWLVFAIAHFLAHTFDGCDGKQARRTNSSSPLGELFDHGLDSSAAFLIPISLFSLFGQGPHSVSLWELYRLMLACLAGFYMAHWEKYNTGTLFLPWTYDASQIAIAFVYLLTFYYGVDLWKIQLMEGFPLCFVFRWSVYGSSLILTLAMTLYNLYMAHVSKTDRDLPFLEGLVPLLSFSLMVFLFCAWAILSPADILQIQPRLFFTATGIVFSNMTCRLIVSTMANVRCQAVNAMFYPLFIWVPIVPFIRSTELEVGILIFYTAAVAVSHVHYGIFLVRELCAHLRISCFSLKKL
ncbi:hypothetical protein ACROYT_G009504 [Oculina patagonica]